MIDSASLWRKAPRPASRRASGDLAGDMSHDQPQSGTDEREAIVVSFYCGPAYYEEAAGRLGARLQALGVDHDLVALPELANQDWISICRHKIRFCRDMLHKHQRSILWVDVDCELLSRPDSMLRSTADVTCFLRNWNYLPNFDPAVFARLINPQFIGYGFNERTISFLDFAVQAGEDSKEPVTDDYLLQHALKTWGGDLRFMLMKPSDVSRDAGNGNAIFMNGSSGSVDRFIGEAAQHTAEAMSVPRQARVLNEAATDAISHGRLGDATAFCRRAFAIDPSNAKAFERFTDLLRRQQDWGALDYHINKRRSDPNLADAALKIDFQSRLDRRQWQKAKSLLEGASSSGSTVHPYMQSRWERISLDRRAELSDAQAEDRVPLWWMETPYPGNLGDILNPYIIERLNGAPPKYQAKAGRVLAIGSIIKFAKSGDHVWGSGSPSLDSPITTGAVYHAVRGPITRDLVIKATGACPEVYGDAAWFLPTLYRPKVDKVFRLGVIPHISHEDYLPPLDDGVTVISLRRIGWGQIEDFVREMLQCEAIISSSLHGIILAHAYGIPVRWAAFPGAERQIHGDGMKFHDYFASVGREDIEMPLDLMSMDRIRAGLSKICIDNCHHGIDLKALAAAAPFKIRDEALLRL